MNELTSPTPRRTNKVIFTACGVVFSLYSVVAFCGYATYGSEVSPNVLRSYPSKLFQCCLFLNVLSKFSSLTLPVVDTIGFGFARVFTSLCVAFAFPVQFFPARNSFLSLIDSIPACKFKDGVADSTELNLRLTIAAVRSLGTY